MSNLTSNNSDNCDFQIEDISTSKGLFFNSFKRHNTKTWGIPENKEELKISQNEKGKIISKNSLNNNYIHGIIENKKKNDIDNKFDKEYLNSINKFNSLNFISSQSTYPTFEGNTDEKNFPSGSDFKNLSYIKAENNEDCEIEDETVTKNMDIQEEEEYRSNNLLIKKSNINVEKSKGCDNEDNILKSGNYLLSGDNKGNLYVGDYIYDDSIRIIRYISEGAQAKVYLGLIEEIDKYVAVKRYSLMETDDNLIDKITAECESVKKLDHPNIIKYFDVDIMYYNNITTIDLIMEFVTGFSLKEFTSSEEFNKNLTKDEKMKKIKFIIRNLLEGISYLHNNKIIHRDLKPENILITNDFGNIKIVDFGVSTKVKDSETYKSRSLLGTPWYMAPEVILEKPYAFEADIWSIGCILYELICGVKPYFDNNPFNAMLKMAQYTSPIEYADEEIKDIFYDKSNRNLLDFLQKCWRANNIFRPSASELLEHQFMSKD